MPRALAPALRSRHEGASVSGRPVPTAARTDADWHERCNALRLAVVDQGAELRALIRPAEVLELLRWNDRGNGDYPDTVTDGALMYPDYIGALYSQLAEVLEV